MRTNGPWSLPHKFTAVHLRAPAGWLRGTLTGIAMCAGLLSVAHGAGVSAGPFEIEFRFERQRGSFPNGDPFKVHQIARYAVSHNGQVLAFNPGGVDPTKPQWFADDLLEAHFVYSKGMPVVLVCAESGTYVVSDRDGKPWVQQLAEQPATRYQFFDSVDGQPGPLETLNLGTEESAMGRDLGREGTLMSLHDEQNINFGVLDLNTLQLRDLSVLKNHGFDTDAPEFDGYRYDASAQGQVRVWWKDRRQFALVRDRYVGDAKTFALEVVNLDEDSFYIVPFDLNRTRLIAVGDVSSAWIEHYFEWSVDATGPPGVERLTAKQNVTPFPWQGTTKADPYGNLTFNLQPVLPAMESLLLDFLTREFGAVIDAPKKQSWITELTIQQTPLSLSYFEDSNSLTLRWNSVGSGALIAQIAERFNREIEHSRYQALFTSLGPAGFSR